MHSRFDTSIRLWGVLSIVAGVWLLSGLATPARAESEDLSKHNMIRIEEDWELYLDGPNSSRGSPQVRVETAPSPDSSFRCVFLVNHRETPASTEGGLEIQVWEGGVKRSDREFGSAKLNTAGEKITWTQYIERNGSAFKFGVNAGSSVTYGDLSSAGLNVNTGDAKLYFPTYTHTHALQKSSIHYGANRLDSLKLLRVRYYTDKDKVFILDVASGTVYKKEA